MFLSHDKPSPASSRLPDFHDPNTLPYTLSLHLTSSRCMYDVCDRVIDIAVVFCLSALTCFRGACSSIIANARLAGGSLKSNLRVRLTSLFTPISIPLYMRPNPASIDEHPDCLPIVTLRGIKWLTFGSSGISKRRHLPSNA